METIEEAFDLVFLDAIRKGVTLVTPAVPGELQEYFSSMYGDKRRYT